jgi:hypothetical protein
MTGREKQQSPFFGENFSNACGDAPEGSPIPIPQFAANHPQTAFAFGVEARNLTFINGYILNTLPGYSAVRILGLKRSPLDTREYKEDATRFRGAKPEGSIESLQQGDIIEGIGGMQRLMRKPREIGDAKVQPCIVHESPIQSLDSLFAVVILGRRRWARSHIHLTPLFGLDEYGMADVRVYWAKAFGPEAPQQRLDDAIRPNCPTHPSRIKGGTLHQLVHWQRV